MKITLFLCFLMALVACSESPKAANASNAKTPKTENPTISEVIVEGCTESVNLTVGQVLKLKLPATAGNGYTWQVAKNPNFMAQTNANSMTFEPIKKEDSEKVGYPSWQTLDFKTMATGEGMLEINYLRPFEPSKIEKSCQIKIQVK